ncbi:MAG: response regulator transcription factor [Gemmatirosa sp.]|nr:response regulator transcription factor [Gemmatirosa sp.]
MPDEMPEGAAPPRRALRVLVVDDEPLARDCVRLALRDAAGVEVVGECADGAAAVDAIRVHRPDVVFLDVQMPGLDGFGVVDAVGVDRMPSVVFVTAFDAHAIRAFEVHALDYVLKPFENDRLLAALRRAREDRRTRRDGALGRRLARLLRGLQTEGGDVAAPRREPVRRFAVRHDGRIRFVAVDEVDWVEADGNYAVLHAGAQRHRVRFTIQALARELDPTRFFQIHRSTIVNLDRVKEVQPWFGGDYVAILTTGEKLRVSRTRAPLLLRTAR